MRTLIKPRLGEGHYLPTTSPVYWLICVHDENTGKMYHSRMTTSKYLKPFDASKECYGIEPTENMVFYNMTTSVVGLRRIMSQLRRKWEKEAKEARR